MTDGIIQEVFNKELHYYDNYESMNPDITINQHLEVVEQIMIELIEKIKQEFIGSSAIYTYQVRNKLIGDNQE